jgi:predicted metal-dependent peptidase
MRKSHASTSQITDSQLAELKRNAAGILAESRKTLLNRFPFIGQIAMSLDLVPIRDNRCPTMCTDGKAIYCDIDFLSKLSNDDRVFILGHEVYHNVLLHLLRRDNREQHTFNLATDMEVNMLLGSDGLTIPKDAVIPSKYELPDGLNAEQYYDLLVKKQEDEQQKNENGGGDSDGNGNSQQSADTSESSSSASSGQFDRHIYKDEQLEDDGPERTDRYGKVEHDYDFQPNVTQKNVEQIREAAVSAAQVIERQGGTLSENIKKIVTSLLQPKLDWKEVLAQYVLKTAGESSRTWNRPNRRFVGRGTYLPSSQTDSLKIIVGIDTSASISSVAPQFLAELNGIVSSFGEYEITVIQCDTKVQNVETYSSIDNPLDCAKMEFNGFGGTMLQPIFDYVKENEVDGSCIVVLTDGYVTDHFDAANAPELPVLWCVTKDGSTDALKFGQVCRLD